VTDGATAYSEWLNFWFVGNTEVSRRYFRVAGNTSKTLNSSELSECIGDLASTGLPLQSTQEFAESVTRRLPREESPP
jgi:hypothetical protein